MVRIVRQFLTTLFPYMPTTLDFRMFSEKDFIGYRPVLEKNTDPLPVTDKLFVKHFVIMEDVDGCSFSITPNYAMSVYFNSDDPQKVDISVIDLDSEETEIEDTIPISDWPARMQEIIISYQRIGQPRGD
jgi:hypothetical protein